METLEIYRSRPERWPQFSIRSLLILMLMSGPIIGFALPAIVAHVCETSATRQMKIVEMLAKQLGRDWETDSYREDSFPSYPDELTWTKLLKAHNKQTSKRTE